MSNKQNVSLSERSIGRVKWYGGHNNKTDRDNKFGFLDSVEYGNVFVPESGLICLPLDMEDGCWVTFRVVEGKKGPSAAGVDLAENESNHSTILKLLKTIEIPIKIRLQSCFHIPLEENHPLIPYMEKTIAEYDRLHSKEVSSFPDSWEKLDRNSPIYKILPEQFRQTWFNRAHPGIKLAIEVLSKPVDGLECGVEIYNSMSNQDRQLALSWTANDSDYEKAKMLSARGAELVAAKFFTEIGKSVLDIAIHQVTGESDNWKYHDFLIDSSSPIDVKNARSTINSNTFVEYTVKRFKKNSEGMDVIIVGVLSPYLTLKELEQAGLEYRFFLHNRNIKILGATTKIQIKNLEREFSKRELTVYFGDAHRWPIWIFNNDLDWFSNQRAAVAEFSKCADQVKSEDWSECQQLVIPAFVIAGMEVPKRYREKLLPWQNWYLDKIVKKSESGELRLPWLYLFTFHHFLEAIINIGSAELKQYSPDGYRELLFYSEVDIKRPASLIDPVGVLRKLINTLNTLWNYRHSAKLGALRSFVFRGEGLLRGIDPQGRKVTVIAYCGGFIEGKGRCGNSPLIIGQQKTCANCQMLICDECSHCSDQCKIEKEEERNRTCFKI